MNQNLEVHTSTAQLFVCPPLTRFEVELSEEEEATVLVDDPRGLRCEKGVESKNCVT